MQPSHSQNLALVCSPYRMGTFQQYLARYARKPPSHAESHRTWPRACQSTRGSALRVRLRLHLCRRQLRVAGGGGNGVRARVQGVCVGHSSVCI